MIYPEERKRRRMEDLSGEASAKTDVICKRVNNFVRKFVYIKFQNFCPAGPLRLARLAKQVGDEASRQELKFGDLI